MIVSTLAAKDAADPDAARRDLLQAFFDFGIMPTQVIELLGHPVESISPAELNLLRGYYNALKGGEGTTWADILDAHGKRGDAGAETKADVAGAATKTAAGTEGLKARVGSATKATAPAASTGAAKSEGAPVAESGAACEFCGEKGGKHKPTCESLK